jgi:hypothetical protein
MGLFRRKQQSVPTGGAREFWEWWTASGAASVAQAHGEGRLDDVVAELSPRVKAVHSALAWEIAAGEGSRLCLVVTAEGDPHVRRYARRWLRRAPAADDSWEYADLRAPVAEPLEASLTVGEVELAAAEAMVAWTRRRNRLDVRLFHPGFAALDDRQRNLATSLLLDQTLGELDVSLWLGRIAPGVEPPAGQPQGNLLDFSQAVTALREELTAEDGGPTWVQMSGETPQGQLTAVARVPLDQAIAPHLDDHVALAVGIADIDYTGFPSPTGLRELRVLEDAIAANLGASGMLVAHETSRGKRTFHYYVDSTTTAADYVKKVAGTWRQGKVTVKVVTDPPWASVSHMRT